jgi:prevent-host-death family protein
MRVVGIKVLKNKLSEYVKIAASGETVLVTDRDRVVAELVPPRTDRTPEITDPVMLKGIREGWLTPPSVKWDGPPPSGEPSMTLEEILEDQARDREDR